MCYSFLQSGSTSDSKVHVFCLHLLQARDKVFDVLLASLDQSGQGHIAAELRKIKKEGWVMRGSYPYWNKNKPFFTLRV